MANPFVNRIVGYSTKPADQFLANPLNFRTHPQRQRDAVQASLRELGWIGVVVENRTTGRLIDGHERVWQALKQNEDVPFIQVELSESEEKLALAVFDPITYMAETDSAILDELLREVNTGESALQELLAELAEENGLYQDTSPIADVGPQVDKAAELQAKWQTASGQLWQLGDHRLICGDCTDAAVVARVMQDDKAELMFTSPPYADMRDYSGNDLSLEALVQIFAIWRPHCRYFAVNLGIQFKDDEVYEYWGHWVSAARKQGLKLLSWNVWDRVNATSVSSQLKMFALTHEWVFVFGDAAKPLNRTWEKSEESQKRERYYSINKSGQKVTTRRQTDGSVKESVIGTIYDNKNMGTVFTGFAEMGRSIDHPAKFPIDLPSGYVGAMTNDGDIVAEPFCGSGTTIIACEQLGRKCRAIEISAAYTAVALQRWADATGKTPVLVG